MNSEVGICSVNLERAQLQVTERMVVKKARAYKHRLKPKAVCEQHCGCCKHGISKLK